MCSSTLVIRILKKSSVSRFEWELSDFVIRMEWRWKLWLTKNNPLPQLSAKKTNGWLKPLEGPQHPPLLSIVPKFRKFLRPGYIVCLNRRWIGGKTCVSRTIPTRSPLEQEDKRVTKSSRRPPTSSASPNYTKLREVLASWFYCLSQPSMKW